jgi:RNA polymerase sigma factor (sigma-70 family)
MLPATTREDQATACLEAADRHRGPLLALACKLAGSPEEGMELYQQTLLNCHDAIQRSGFAGDRYHFYLAQSMRHLHTRGLRRHSREIRMDFQFADAGGHGRDDEGDAPWSAAHDKVKKAWEEANTASPVHAEAQLAEQVMAEARQQFSFADRVALRLSVDGLSCQQIAEHIGTKDQSWVWRRLQKMKAQLRQTFQQAWDALGEPEY